MEYYFPRRPRYSWLGYFLMGLLGAVIGGLLVATALPGLAPDSILPPGSEATNANNTQSAPPSAPTDPVLAPEAPTFVYPSVYAADKVGPAVVGILNRGVYYDRSGQRRVVDRGFGSGFILDSKGHVVTNYHVIESAQEIVVVLADGSARVAQVVGTDRPTDLAVIKIQAENLAVATLGDSDKLKVGEPVLAIGNPLDMEFQRSVTSGVISGLNRKIQYDEREFKVIQTDAVINPGNSGGPLVNMEGEVIGINTLKLLSGEGMGFAIPINTAKPIIQELIEKGRVSRAWMGVWVAEKEIAATYGIYFERGLYVARVGDGSPAQKAGIREGDIILKIGAQDVNSFEDLKAILQKHKPNERLTVIVQRNNTSVSIEVVLGEMPSQN
ncbi:MAG: trypsin-like peptidase domain-containing protein [Bacillota bacterium]